MIIYPDNYNPWRIAIYFAFIPVCLIINALLRRFGLLEPRCPECRSICTKRDELRQVAAPDRDGIGVKIWECPECHWRREREYRILRPASYSASADPRYVPGGLMRRYLVGSEIPGFSDAAGGEGASVLVGRTTGGISIIASLLLLVFYDLTSGWILAVSVPAFVYGVIRMVRSRGPVSTVDDWWNRWRPWFNPYGRADQNGGTKPKSRRPSPPRDGQPPAN